jgi:hypothetical protein
MFAVDRGGVNEQRCRRETIVILPKVDRMIAAFGDLAQEFAKGFEHGCLGCDISAVRM